MKIAYEYSHLGGSEILRVRYPDLEKEIYEIISKVKAQRTKISQKKTMKGKQLFSPKEMNKQFTQLFNLYGYKELRDT